MALESLGSKKYGLVIVDCFSRFTWVIFLLYMDEACEVIKMFWKRVHNEKGFCISSIEFDHGGEFEKYVFEKFCNKNVIFHNFSSPRTPKQNGVVERKNKSLQEMARTMLLESGFLKGFWAETVNITCYIQNHVFIRSIIKKPSMNYRKKGNPIYLISRYLDQDVLYLT